MRPPGKVLAVDPGERRVGFAISDPDRKFAFLSGTAYRRILTGDHKLSDRDIEDQVGGG